MSNTKWTLGEWIADIGGVCSQGGSPSIRVADTDMHPGAIARVLSNLKYPGISEEDAAEKAANAHLIAAAPELYEALNAVMHWWHYGDSGDMPASAEMAAVSALAKARGEK